jgi:membrane fusion protein
VRPTLITQAPIAQAPLFRQEAVIFQQQQRQWGEIALLQSVPNKLLSWGTVATVALILVFLCIAPYARKETAAGYLSLVSGTARVIAPQLGVIENVFVQEGQAVRAGAPLLSVALPQVTAEGQDVNTTILDVLADQRNRLRAQIAAEESRVTDEQARLAAQARNLEAEIAGLQGQVTLQADRIRLAENIVEAAAKLRPGGLISSVEHQHRQDAMLQQKQALSALGEQLVERQTRLAETRSTLAQLPTVMASQLMAQRSELSATEQHIAEIKGRHAYVLRAPISGRVSTLQASVGEVADPRRRQLDIVPTEDALQATLFVPSRAIGFVRPGQQVRLRYDAFPYQKFGAYGGRILAVSRTVLSEAEIVGPFAPKEPSYKVTVALNRPDVLANGQSVPLRPDMRLQADVILERRSLLHWLLGPLLSAGLPR